LRQSIVGFLVAAALFEGLVAALGALGMVLPSKNFPLRAPGAEFYFAGNFYAFPEFETPVKLNADGLHDTPRALLPEPTVRRVALWGDSLVEGYQVEVEELCSQHLQRALMQRAAAGKISQPVEVLNLAHSGTRAAGLTDPRTLEFLAQRGVTDVVVMWHGAMEAAHALASGGTGLLPPCVTGGWNRPSRLHRLALQSFRLDGAYLLLTSARRIATDSGNAEPADFFYRAREVDAPGRPAMWATLGNTLAQVAALQSKGFRVSLAYLPTLAEVRALRASRTQSVSALGLALDYGLLERRTQELAGAAGLPLWSVTSAIAMPEGSTHFESDKHWTAEGHRRVAQALEEPLSNWLQAVQPPSPIAAGAPGAARPPTAGTAASPNR
jgi:hypothetical protein